MKLSRTVLKPSDEVAFVAQDNVSSNASQDRKSGIPKPNN
jgi:hypothetical protein